VRNTSSVVFTFSRLIRAATYDGEVRPHVASTYPVCPDLGELVPLCTRSPYSLLLDSRLAGAEFLTVAVGSQLSGAGLLGVETLLQGSGIRDGY